MMRGLAVAGPRPSQGVAAQIKNADIEDVSRLGVELLARLTSGLGQRRLTHRNPDLRVTSIDQRGTPIPAVRGTEIERQGSFRVFGRLPDTDARGCTEAGVRKASREETAREFAPTLVSVYGGICRRCLI